MDGYRILFHSAASGIVLLIVARLLLLAGESVIVDPFPYVVVSSGILLSSACVVAACALLWIAAHEVKKYPSSALSALRRIAPWRIAFWVCASGFFLGTAAGLVYTWPGDAYWGRIFFVATTCALGAITVVAARVLATPTESPVPYIAFRIALFALILAGTAAATAGIAESLPRLWERFVPYEWSGTAFLACLLGATLWVPLNLLWPFQVAARRVHTNNHTGELEKLLFLAASDQALTFFSLKDGKIYVGLVASVPAHPGVDSKFIRILPIASGYREKDTKRMTLTTFYTDVYSQLAESQPDVSFLADFYRVIPVGEVQVAGRFDFDAYNRFSSNAVPTRTKGGARPKREPSNNAGRA